jgi:phosphoribosyl-dephospho-CoA transferase
MRCGQIFVGWESTVVVVVDLKEEEIPPAGRLIDIDVFDVNRLLLAVVVVVKVL